ncbi:DUF1127 domain-containing protein [Notoacmeibacter marinus]|uniref:DUF1127 domain-containing protein n=1 Tax=Notoacmeibacter marinus TaxID=1876515 RepID=A0A231UWG0_9HYPH|nr:DUF1127 domain-containing protein [Notoacmeibacter marinus]OXT00212.1 DUF1127 domain-containing protein [Notoacmeibacter marinus]
MHILENYRRWRMYRKTVDQLSHLSDAQLHDIGLNRSSIHQAARRSL